MFPLSLTSLHLETLDIMHFHADFQNSDSLICLINHYSGLELHQSIRTTSCIYPAHGGLVCLQLSTKNAEELLRWSPIFLEYRQHRMALFQSNISTDQLHVLFVFVMMPLFSTRTSSLHSSREKTESIKVTGVSAAQRGPRLVQLSLL